MGAREFNRLEKFSVHLKEIAEIESDDLMSN